MKRVLSIALLCLLCLSCLSVGAAAEEPTQSTENSVYLSDNGDDANSGATAGEAVKTFERAQEILGETGGVILIPDVYTYAGSFGYYMPYVEGASYIIRGVAEDGSSRFVHNRKNIAMNNPLTFDNLTYEITANTWSSLIANFNRLEITESVTILPYNGVEERNNYLFVYGGAYDGGGVDGQNTELVLNGGTYGYVVGGCKMGEMQGSVSVTVGGSANIINRLYCGGEGTPNDIYGGITVQITGGTIGGEIYLGGSGDGTFVSGDVSLTVTGGEFASIYCRGSSGGEVWGDITIDVSGYAPAGQDAQWGMKYIKDVSENTTVVGTQVTEPTPPENPTDSEESTSSEEDTDAPTPPDSIPSESEVPAVSEAAPTGTDAGTTAPSRAGEGCSSVASLSCLIGLMLAGAGAALVIRKKKL